MRLFIVVFRGLFVWLRQPSSWLLAWLLMAIPVAAQPQVARAVVRPASLPVLVKVHGPVEGGLALFLDRVITRNPHAMQVPACGGCEAPSRQERADWHTTPLYPREYNREIDAAARRYRLDPALVRAVIHAESGFNTHARSSKGARGLMQLMPATARALGVRQPHNPHENIDGGTRYLAEMLARFRNDVSLAAAAYNAGPQAVQAHAGVPPYHETRAYVQRVRVLLYRYRRAAQLDWRG
jgi:soluble lytic murein transglycosylase-like protein